MTGVDQLVDLAGESAANSLRQGLPVEHLGLDGPVGRVMAQRRLRATGQAAFFLDFEEPFLDLFPEDPLFFFFFFLSSPESPES